MEILQAKLFSSGEDLNFVIGLRARRGWERRGVGDTEGAGAVWSRDEGGTRQVEPLFFMWQIGILYVTQLDFVGCYIFIYLFRSLNLSFSIDVF